MKPIEVILFDIGGVLVELNGTLPMLQWSSQQHTVEQLWEIWLTSPAVRAFETGRSNANQFAEALIQEMGLSVKTDQFIEAFCQWPKGVFPGVLELITPLKQHYTLACLSNANELHWPRLMEEMKLNQVFDHYFPSHLIGSLKPDREAFDYVLNHLQVEAASVLFLDDNALNVKSAQEVGMVAYTVKHPNDMKRAFEDAGISKS